MTDKSIYATLLACLTIALLIRQARRRQPSGRAEWFRWYSEIYLRSWHWRMHRRLKFWVYGRRCRECGETRGPIQLHHAHGYKCLWHERVIGKYDTVILCKACHARVT